MAHLIMTKDSVACQKAISVIAKVLPMAVRNEGLRSFIGRELLMAALKVKNLSLCALAVFYHL